MRFEFKAGFSLIEVVIAFGVVSFAILSCVGLNATSLVALREARAQEISNRIFGSVLREAQVSDYTNLAALEGRRFYDSEGTKLAAAATDTAVFRAVIRRDSASVADPSGTSTLNDSTKIVVTVFRAGLETSNTLVSTRFAVIGNRMKSAD